MQWKRIPKEQSKQPKSGTYKEWKPLLAEEGSHRCVYCAIHEASMGGIRNFHVEHYRPQSKFPKLKNKFSNLFYSCPICNSFKRDDWPAAPDNNDSICYPDPSIHDYSDLFEVFHESGLVEGRSVASCYMVEKLYLNRSQLILERRQAALEYALGVSINVCRELVARLRASLDDEKKADLVYVEIIDLVIRYSDIESQIILLYRHLGQISPYEIQDTKRK